MLTQRGKVIAAMPNGPSKSKELGEAILQSPFIRKLVEDLQIKKLNVVPTKEIADWVSRNSNLGFSTAYRRASSVSSLIRYALENR
jgi:hypothetical protein